MLAIVHTGAKGQHFTSITNTDGLSDLLVNEIYKDAKGYVWFGTSSSLDRFDGNAVKSYTFPGDNMLTKRVATITGSEDGVIYAGNRQGLYKVTPGSNVPEPVLDNVINFPVNTLAYDPSGILYIGTGHGLYVYDIAKDTSRRILLQSDILSKENEITALTVADAGKLWVATASSLYHVSLADGSNTSYRFPFPSSYCTRMLQVDNKIYIATLGSGLTCFDSDSHTFDDIIHVGNDLVSDISLRGDTLYIATDGEGLFTFDNDKVMPIGSPLRSKSIYSLLVDEAGLIWVGYYQGGVDYTPYIGNIFSKYPIPDTDADEAVTVRALLIDGMVKLIGTREGLFYVDEQTGKHIHFKSPEIGSNIIFSIAKWHGRYYIGTYGGGLYELDPSTHRVQKSTIAPSGLDNRTIFVLKTDHNGDLWAGTSAGLYKFHNGHTDKHYTSVSSQLPAGNVYEIFFDSRNRGWVCTESGMALITDDIVRSDNFPQGFINNDKIRCVYEDSDNTLYFLPDRGDIFTSNIDLTEFGKCSPCGNRSGMTTFAIEDRDGYMWFGTDRGLVRYDRDGHTHLFNRADGLPDPVFTLCPPAAEPDGDLWFGNNSGLVKLSYSDLDADRLYPMFAVTDIEANGRNCFDRVDSDGPTPKICLTKNENDINFRFSNFRYTLTGDMAVEYKLEGYDTDWKVLQGNAMLSYYDLRPGLYNLLLRTPGSTVEQILMTVKIDDEINWLIIALLIIVLATSVWAGHLYFKHRHKSEELIRHQEEAKAAIEKKKQNLYKTTRLTDDDCRGIEQRLGKIMKEQKPYTNPDLKIQALADLAGVTAHDMSYFFNQYLQKSYYDYVNEFRVEEFKRIAENTDVSKYTLTALSQMCGFSSRASFFRHFKAVTGITPAEFLKKD